MPPRSASLFTATAVSFCVAIASCSAAPAQTPATADSCDRIAAVKFDGVEIVSVKSEPAELPIEGVHLFGGMMGKPELGPPAKGLPAFCRVSGRIRPEPGSNISFEVWMPAQNWNGRLSGLGIGGFAGSIDYLGLSSAVKAGQAGMATDTGHAGSMVDSTWAAGHPERVRDYGWRAIHVSTVAAKEITAAYYGRAPEHAYFVGCSGGGRQGLTEASRYPIAACPPHCRCGSKLTVSLRCSLPDEAGVR